MTNSILIVDDSPAAVPELKAVLESQGYTVVTALRAEEALDTLRTTKIDLVIAEALLPGMDGFELVRQMRKMEEWSQIPVIMLTVRSAPEDYALSYEVGADEYFLKPMEPPKILAAAKGLIMKYEMLKASGTATTRRGTAASLMPARLESGWIITVFSLKGGVGTSTLAVNLAVAIKQLTPSSRVGLIDLSLEQGADELLLDVKPTSTIAEWARETLPDATPFLLNQYFVQHRSGISLMAAPPSPEQAETVRPEVVRKTLELAPQSFDYVVVDTASTFSESTLIALEAAESILLPVTPDIASLKTASNTLRILKAVNISSNRVKILLNELVPEVGMTKGQIESRLGKDVTVIPYNGPEFIEASIQGIPLVTHAPTVPAARAIVDVAKTLCEPEATELSPDLKAKPGLFKGLERLRRAQ